MLCSSKYKSKKKPLKAIKLLTNYNQTTATQNSAFMTKIMREITNIIQKNKRNYE